MRTTLLLCIIASLFGFEPTEVFVNLREASDSSSSSMYENRLMLWQGKWKASRAIYSTSTDSKTVEPTKEQVGQICNLTINLIKSATLEPKIDIGRMVQLTIIGQGISLKYWGDSKYLDQELHRQLERLILSFQQ